MELKNKLKHLLAIKPTKVAITLDDLGELSITLQSTLNGTPLVLTGTTSTIDGEWLDVVVTHSELNSTIEKQNINEAQLTKLSEVLTLYVNRKGGVSADYKNFNEVVLSAVEHILNAHDIASQGGISIIATFSDMEITVIELNTNRSTSLLLGGSEHLFPLGVSTSKGKHSIISDSSKLVEVFKVS